VKSIFVALTLVIAGLAVSLAPGDADAKRLGGGKPAGMQRQAPPPQQATPANNAAPQQTAPVAGATAPAAAGTAAAAGKRSWLGPIAGIAAGLGLAALFSHLGMGEGFANILTMLLMAGVAFFVIRWLLRRFAAGAGASKGGLQMAGAGANGSGGGSARPFTPIEPTMQRTAVGAAPVAPAVSAGPLATMPEGFDAQDFERTAKMIFVRLQAANDAGEVEDLRKFTTPELFASLRVDLQERTGKPQQTDVLQLEAKVVDTVKEDNQWIVSVRFSGLIREASEQGAERFEELWHLVKPVDGRREWAIAGITPVA
jgi:predicted lipid-binding transport protein (Tim44 family)